MPLRYASDTPLRGDPIETQMKDGFSTDTAMVALQKAILATFNSGKWEELGYRLQKHDIIVGHSRLLRSLQWGDEDYGGNVFAILRHLVGSNFEHLGAIEDFVGLRAWLKQKDQGLYAELYDDAESTPTVPLEQLEEASAIHDVADLNRHAARIRSGIVSDPAQAIGSAKELLETVMKTILGKDEPGTSDDINVLLRHVREQLDLDPKSAAAGANATLKRTLSSLGQIVVGVAEVRNLHGTGHGRTRSKDLQIAHARLVVNAAITVATFLLEIWRASNS